jgi:hypothetical protein
MPKRIAALLLGSTLLYPAYAAHPLVTEDTGTQDQGNSQLETNTDFSLANDGSDTRSAALTYSYGALKNLDIFVNTPLTLSAPSGINDVSLGAKWRFYENGPASLAFKPELLMPSGNADKGLGNGRASASLSLVGSYDAAPWAWHANLAVNINHYRLPADQDANRSVLWRASLAVTHALSEQWKLVFDTGIARNRDSSSRLTPAYLLGGMIYSPAPSLDLDAGIRYGIGCRSCDGELDRQIGFGLTWRF